MPWTFGMIALAMWLVSDRLRHAPAADEPSHVAALVTIAAALLLIAIGARGIGRRLGGWQGRVVAAAAAVMFLIKAGDIVVSSPLVENWDWVPTLRSVSDYGYPLAWIAISVALATVAWRRDASRHVAAAFVVITPIAKPIPLLAAKMIQLGAVGSLLRVVIIIVHVALLLVTTRGALAGQPRADQRQQWLRGSTAVARLGIVLLIGSIGSLGLSLMQFVATPDFIATMNRLGFSAIHVSAVVALWMIYELAIVVSLDHEGAPKRGSRQCWWWMFSFSIGYSTAIRR